MQKNKYLLRISTFIVGLFVMAFGVALSVKADLGVSPISCIPYVFSRWVSFSLGELTIAFNIFVIILQIALLRKNYRLIQLIQLPVVFVFGLFIDLSMNLINDIQFTYYGWKAVGCLLSCFILALGVFLEVKANITYLPGEGLALAITETFKKEFGKAKVGVDSSMVIVGIICSFILLHELQGIREGTVLAAVLVGVIAKFYNKKLGFIFSFITPETSHDSSTEQDLVSKRNLVITISREYGSGGHEIGKAIAKELGLSFYDKNLIKLTAEQSGFSARYIQENEQKLASSLLSDLYTQNYSYINEQQPPLDALFLVQSKIIRDIATKESCVIVGRCANFILKDDPNCFNVFIHANDEYRKKKISEEYGVKSEITKKELIKKDKERANYSLHYTGWNWNDASNYHITIDSSVYGTEETVRLIINAVEEFKNKGQSPLIK